VGVSEQSADNTEPERGGVVTGGWGSFITHTLEILRHRHMGLELPSPVPVLFGHFANWTV
jgi:hypothetical protein